MSYKYRKRGMPALEAAVKKHDGGFIREADRLGNIGKAKYRKVGFNKH